MAVQIRLARYGTKKTPFYRVVVTDVRSPRDGRFIESVGTFNPTVEPPAIQLNQSRIEFWQGQGAKATATASHVIKQHKSRLAALPVSK
jgi:small subunit ribosomal protein S16